MDSDVICFKCRLPLEIIEEGNYDDDELDYLDEHDLSKGKCVKCGQIAYFTVEWIFTVSIPKEVLKND